MDAVKPQPQENPEDATKQVLSLQETPIAEDEAEGGDDVLAHSSQVSLAACAKEN